MRPPEGKVTDYGDLVHVEQWLVKGRRLTPVWRIGAPRKTTAADRVSTTIPLPRYERADLTMDLKADQKVTLSLSWTDEVGNPTTPPADATAVFTVDNADVIALTDNGDGTAVAAATGTLGNATVHAEINYSGRTATGDTAFFVVPGDADRVEVVASEPTEVTPDEEPAP